jgi:O-acetyl-ADP-ribose deacetylase (regulator of RNase III)/ADP-ribose pyrophosphatase YjhB (NUDIX family)
MKIRDIEIEVVRGDITRLDVEAIVYAASSTLEMDKGVAEFIKKEGGSEIEEEAVSKGPIAPGEAVWTKAGGLPAQYVIHAAARGNDAFCGEGDLRKAVASALKCANELHLSSLGIAALGGCEGGLPMAGAAKIAVQEIMKESRNPQTTLRKIVFCLYDDETFKVFDNTVRGYVRHMMEQFGPYVAVDVIIECPAGLLGGDEHCSSLEADASMGCGGQGGIILIERSSPPYGWALPGGFVDYGESLEEAAIREAREETNMELIDLRQFHAYSHPGRDPRFHTISTVFIAEGQGEPRAGDDAGDLRIVRYEDLLELEYAFDHGEIIEEYLVEKGFD